MNYYLRKPQELVSPQLGAVTGKRFNINPAYSSYLEGMSQYLPEIYRQKEERERLEEEEDLRQKQYKQARRDANVSLGIEGAGLALQAKPFLKDIGGKLAGDVSKEVAKDVSGEIYGSTVAGTTAGEGGTTLGTMGTIGAGLAPAGLGLTAGGIYGGLSGAHDWGKKIGKTAGFGGEKEWDVAGSALTGAAAGATYGAFAGPLGSGIGALIGAGSGALSQACIIVTACTDSHSYEVNVARDYRDTFMDKTDLRGYYRLAEKVVPILEKHEFIKNIVHNKFVDRLVDYGEYWLGYKMEAPRISSTIVTKLFLKLCNVLGKGVPVFVRCNGEVI